MSHEGRFQLVTVAIDEYPPGLDELPSSCSARRLEEQLRDWGTTSTRSARDTQAQGIRTALADWTDDGGAAPSSFVYWAGHGWDDGDNHWLITSETELPPNPANAIAAAELATFLVADSSRRDASADPLAWTVVVLDCCGAPVGVTNILHELTKTPASRPRRCVFLPVTEEGGAFAGRFVEKLGDALEALTANDEQIVLRELLTAVADRLGDVQPEGSLPASIVLFNKGATGAVMTVNVDALEELQRVVDDLTPQVRTHFFAKAQGGETGEPAWYFAGRSAELERLARWLRTAPAGMFVVTGKPGAGKSAILGYAITLADQELVSALREAKLLGAVPVAARPPDGVFDATIHLTGMTVSDCLRGVGEALGVDDWTTGLDAALRDRAAAGGRSTLLADALDEAQEPLPIARALHRLSNMAGVRVVVGTRRSLAEALDAPATGEDELLHALGGTETMVVERDSDAVASYVERRLCAPTSPYRDRPEAVEDLIARIAARDQPFLYARLVTGELLARPAFATVDPALDELVRGDHRTLFAVAVKRLGGEQASATALLDALAWARGRGLPRTGAVWATVARSLHPDAEISEETIDRVLAAAAPYVTLDGEAGQSSYRLAHQVFVEHLRSAYVSRAEPTDAQRLRLPATAMHVLTARQRADYAIARGLVEAVRNQGGWQTANAYVIRYLPQHLGESPNSLAALCTNLDYLRRALAVLGVDGLDALLMEVLADRLKDYEPPSSGLVPTSDPRGSIDLVASAIRQSRVALGRDPEQLRAQLYARLPDARQEPALMRLSDALRRSPGPWLRARTLTLGRANDLDAVQRLPARARAVSFGEIDGKTAVVVGAGTQVYLWDPRSATAAPLPGLPYRPTAVAAGTIAGRSIVVAAGGYDASVSLFDLDRGEWRVMPVEPPAVPGSICLTTANRRPAIVIAGTNSVELHDCETGELIVERAVRAQAIAQTSEGVLSAAVHEGRLVVCDSVTGFDPGPQAGVPLEPPWDDPIVAIGEAGGDLVVAMASRADGRAGVWNVRTASPVDQAIELDFPVRSLAVGDVDGRVLLAAVNETEQESGFVVVRQATPSGPLSDLRSAFRRALPSAPNPVQNRVLGVGCVDGTICALVPGVGLVDVATGGVVAPDPAPEVVSTILVGSPDVRLVDLPAPELPRPSGSGPAVIDQPSDWPETARAYGLLDGRPVMVRGSYEGLAVMVDAATGTLLTSGPGSGPLELRFGSKPSPREITDIDVGTGDGIPIVAIAFDGALSVHETQALETVPTPWITATTVRSVTLGEIGSCPVLATGGEGGGIALWDLRERRRITALTLDQGINGLWMVADQSLLVARTVDGLFHLFDVMTGDDDPG